MRGSKPPQLDKVLALADSSFDGEAVVAVRMARRLLSRDGLSFGDLARAAGQKPPTNLSAGFFPSRHPRLEAEITQLRQALEDIRSEKIVHETQAEVWRLRTADLEQKLRQSQAEAARWRQLAQETADKLWDLGHALQGEEEEPSSQRKQGT